ncbi:hypothetical protein XENOCAPTIV_002089 [Xenoophorus captivus]|uniref:Uncharacterized protein n=1 Tax=Xenoophorus captivus TaxID=1517983 RepID=A0ABV0QFY2_9TELE
MFSAQSAEVQLELNNCHLIPKRNLREIKRGEKDKCILFFYLSPAFQLLQLVSFLLLPCVLSLSLLQLYSVLASPLHFSLSHCAANSEPLEKEKKEKGWGDTLSLSISHTQSNHPSNAFTNNRSKTPPTYTPTPHTHQHPE